MWSRISLSASRDPQVDCGGINPTATVLCGPYMMTSVREERLQRMISIVAFFQDAKLCAHAARISDRNSTFICRAHNTKQLGIASVQT